MSDTAILRTEKLTKTYSAVTANRPELELFRELDLVIAPGEMVAIVGESGAGKSSLLHLLAALAWAEAVTNIQDGHAPDAIYDEVRAHFSEVETVNLTLAITTINAWNRIAIALGDFPGHAGGAVAS